MLNTKTTKNSSDRNGYTMIELIFVIVILGILASVAIPRLAATRGDAEIVKGRNDIAAIRSSIVTKRSQDILSGKGAVYPDLNGTKAGLFSNVLDYPVYAKSGNGHWQSTNSTNYTYTVNNVPVLFTYTKSTGSFDCVHTTKECKQLTE